MSAELPPEPQAPVTPLPPAPRSRWRLVFFALLALVGAGIAGAVIWSRTSPAAVRENALTAARDGPFAAAEADLQGALARDPNDAEVVAAMARGCLAAGRFAEADGYLDRWVELQPENRDARRLRYDHYRAAKNIEKAYPDGLRLLDLEPTDSPLRRDAKAQMRRTLMGNAFSLGRFEDAEALCRACLIEAPGDPALRAMLAQVRRARGDSAGAGAVLDELLKEHPNNTQAMLGRAILFLESGEPEKAVPLLRGVLKTDRTRQRSAGYQLVIALERTGQTEEADRVAAEVRRLQDVEVFGEAMKSQPDNQEIRVRLAGRLIADGHTGEGLAHLQAVLAVEPNNRAAHLALAAYYEKQGQPDRAAEHRKRAGPNP